LTVILEPLLAFFNALSYIVTYASLVICLFTVIATLLWYPRVRKKFSSPIQHSGVSVARLILVTTVLIIIIQIGVTFLYPDFLNQISFGLFLVSLAVFTIRNSVAFGGAYLHKRREQHDLNSGFMDGTPLVTVIVQPIMKKRLLAKTVEALLKLSYVNKEILVVDDGSTDGTLETAKNMQKMIS